MANNDVNNQKKFNNAFNVCRYIAVIFGVILLSNWTVKSAPLVNSTTQVLQQNLYKEITGIVKTEEGDPIPGVVILKVGTTQGTDTDIDGRYSLSANEGDKIQFVYDGFKTTTVTVSKSNILNITMIEDDTSLSLEDIYLTMVKDRMVHGNKVFSNIIVKRRQDSIFKEITGVVKTEEGDPIPGAVVLKVGTNQGTDTDLEGKYSLNANDGDKIQFVYEGFKTTTLTVGKSNILNATMIEDGIDLTDITVDLYRITSKETIGGCGGIFYKPYKPKAIDEIIKEQNVAPISTVTPEMFNCRFGVKDFISTLKEDKLESVMMLKAQMISLDFSKRYNSSDRNPETILKDVENLTRNGNYTYIVDGVRVSEETFRSLNQNDVESVDIYKHTDVYNARFGNKENQSRISLNAR